jgi:hypothetical protein
LIIVRGEVVGFGGFTGPPDDEGRVCPSTGVLRRLGFVRDGAATARCGVGGCASSRDRTVATADT